VGSAGSAIFLVSQAEMVCLGLLGILSVLGGLLFFLLGRAGVTAWFG
jgi:hypothetical protein